MSSELDVLKEISKKLDQMIFLLTLSNRDVIKDLKEEIRGDKVSRKLLDYSDDSLTSPQIIQKVSKELKVSERTVERKIKKLKENGFLLVRREGREIYYKKSDLFD